MREHKAVATFTKLYSFLV